MLTARVLGSEPNVFFAAFDAAVATQKLTTASVKAAQTDIGLGLTGTVDTASIADFISTRLIAATQGSPTSGDAQDKLLDALKLKLSNAQIGTIATALTSNQTTDAIKQTVVDMMTPTGGGSSSTATPTIAAPEGVFTGTWKGPLASGISHDDFNAIILENGDFWFFYGTQSSYSFQVANFVEGTGASNNGSFTSSNSKDFGYYPARVRTISASYNPTAQTISGTGSSIAADINFSGDAPSSFSGGLLTNSTYNYATPATLSSITGAWTTTDTQTNRVLINVAASGAFTATETGGCVISGTVTPRASGRNVFDVIKENSVSCSSVSKSGISFVYPLSTGRTQVIFALVDATRSYGSVFSGAR